MAVIKVYSRINWLNKSESLTTPLGKTNLNKMDKAIDTIDNEVVSISSLVETLDTTKVSADQLNNMVTDISFNDKNGVISITKYNGTVLNIDTAIEKIAVNFEYNAQTQQLVITLESGEKQYIDMSELITQYEFKDTDTIAFSIDSSGKVSASIKNGSITKAMLSSEVMASITLSENNAAASAKSAEQSATNADMDAKLSQSYSVGKSGIREGEDTDNSKYYSEQAKKYADEAQEIAGGNFIPKSEKGAAGGVATLNDDLAVEKAVGDEDGNNIKETYAKKTEISQAIDVDTELSETSTNPVENKAIAEAVNNSNKKITNLEESKADKIEVPSLVKVDNTTVFLSEDGTLSSKGGLSDDDRKKLDSIEDGANKTVLQNNLVTTVEGYALDARQGKVLDDKITELKNESITHNIPRITPKDITSYITDGTFYKRLNGTDGYSLFEDIFVGDYIKMSRPITCPNQDSSVAVTGSQYVTVIGLDTLMYNGDSSYINYHHAVMTAGQGFGGTQHFGRHRMNAVNTSVGGYVGSEMNKSIIGDVVTSGSISSGATINQQLYAEFGSHLKTTRELVSSSINATGYNRLGKNTGCSSGWTWINAQAILMSEVEVCGSIVWSSSGYDVGTSKKQMPLFAHSIEAINNRSDYWLKDVADGNSFCYLYSAGYFSLTGASTSTNHVRPRFVLSA